MITRLDEAELFQRASHAWRRYCSTWGYVHDNPSDADSSVSGKVVTLRNGNGLLAVYRWTGKRVVKVMKTGQRP